MRLLLGLADRLLFAIALVAAMQLPQFVDQYTQRYGGYHQALVDSLAEHQRNADQHYGGNLDQLIADLHASSAVGIREIGDKLGRDRGREAEMRSGLAILERGSLPAKLWYLAKHLDGDIAAGTCAAFAPGLPLSLDALLCGLFGGLLATLLFNALRSLLGAGWRQLHGLAD